MAPASALSPNSTQTVITLVFGLTATIVGGLTVWQAYNLWKTWSGRPNNQISESDHITGYELDADLLAPGPVHLNEVPSGVSDSNASGTSVSQGDFYHSSPTSTEITQSASPTSEANRNDNSQRPMHNRRLATTAAMLPAAVAESTPDNLVQEACTRHVIGPEVPPPTIAIEDVDKHRKISE